MLMKRQEGEVVETPKPAADKEPKLSEAFAAWMAGGSAKGIRISMDGKGAWRDNVFVEHIWKSVKYEEVYLRAYASVSEARASIGRYLAFYNGRRPHQSPGPQTPDQAYFNALQPIPVAA
jgi:putative transposase